MSVELQTEREPQVRCDDRLCSMVGHAMLNSARADDVLTLAKTVRYLMTQLRIVRKRARDTEQVDMVEYMDEVEKSAAGMLHSDQYTTDKT